MDTLQQLILVDTLSANWDAILMRIGPVSPAFAQELSRIGEQLRTADSPAELAKVIDALLTLARDTPAAGYVRELAGRARLDQAGALRETTVAPGDTASAPNAATALALESSGDFGAALARGPGTANVVRVPVYFGTNRKPGATAGSTFLADIADTTSYGVVWVSIPLDAHELGQVETPKWWNVLANKDDAQKYFTLGRVDALAQTAFQSDLAKAVLAAASPQILVFLHGYNVTFDEAAMRAAQFAHDSRFTGLVVLFSWPSQGSIRGYGADEDRALASGDPLANFLRTFEGGPWNKVHLLAHSMGNRVLLSALADNPRPKLPLQQIIFAAADVYVPVFREKFPKLQSLGSLAATSYASRRDRALWVSSLLHQGPRLGLFDDTALPTDGLEAIDSTAVDRGLLAHGYWSGARPLITDIRTLLLQGLDAKDRGLEAVGKHWAFPK